MKRHLYKMVAFTDAGKVRQENEDQYCLKMEESKNGTIVLAAVADGMGGLMDGQRASQTVIAMLETWWENKLPELLRLKTNNILNLIETSLDDYLNKINSFVFSLTEKKMGTTLSLLLLIDNQYLIKHCGDSRIYFLRTIGLEQVTDDQTWYEQELHRGTLPQYDAAQKRKMRNVLTNAIGVKKECWFQRAVGDLDNIKEVLLCTDGVYKYISQEEIETLLSNKKTVEAKKTDLQNHLQISEAADNYTVIIIQKETSRWKFFESFRIR